MTETVEPRLTARQWVAIVANPMLDHSYRLTTTGSHITAYLAYKKLSRRSERTLDSVERTLARLATTWPDHHPTDYTSSQLLELIATYPPGSHRKIRSHLSEFFRWAIAWEHIERDPMLRVPTIDRDPPPVLPIFTEAEQARLCALPELRDRALMLLLFGTGIRDGEARTLTLHDVDLEQRHLHVTGKGRRQRLIPLPERVTNALAELELLEGLNPGDHLWYRRRTNQSSSTILRDRPIVYSGFHGWWTRCLTHARVTYRKPHTTRHTYATLYLRAGGRMERLSRILGHANTAITEQHYAHMDVTDLAQDVGLVMIARGWE